MFFCSTQTDTCCTDKGMDALLMGRRILFEPRELAHATLGTEGKN